MLKVFDFLKRSGSIYVLLVLAVVYFSGYLSGAILLFCVPCFAMSVFVDLVAYGQFRDLRSTNRQLQYIDQLTTAMRQSMKLNEVLDLVMKNLTNELGYERVLIFSFEHRGYRKDVLAPIAGLKMAMEKLNNFYFKFDKAEDIVPKCAIEKKPYIVRNAPEDHRCSQSFVELLNLKEYVVVPLIAKDVIVGVLLADDPRGKKQILELDLTALSVFANQAAMAIENARLYEKIEQLAVTDGLTHVYNHRYFQEALKNELNRLERYYKIPTEKVSLIMLDIDNFKKYNDMFGHQSGDAILTELGQILKNRTRKVDIVARYGGEEFVMILPSTPKEGALIFAERLREAIAIYPFEMRDGKQQNLTVSIGVATYEDDAKSAQEMIEIADKGLYKAKLEGKNRVCYIDPRQTE